MLIHPMKNDMMQMSINGYGYIPTQMTTIKDK